MCVSNCTMGQYWRRYRFFYWLLRGCAGNWGKICPLNSPIVHFNRIPSQSQMSNFRKEIMILIPCFSSRIMQKSSGNFHALSVKPSTGVCTLLLCHSISLRCLQRFYVGGEKKMPENRWGFSIHVFLASKWMNERINKWKTEKYVDEYMDKYMDNWGLIIQLLPFQLRKLNAVMPKILYPGYE